MQSGFYLKYYVFDKKTEEKSAKNEVVRIWEKKYEKIGGDVICTIVMNVFIKKHLFLGGGGAIIRAIKGGEGSVIRTIVLSQ